MARFLWFDPVGGFIKHIAIKYTTATEAILAIIIYREDTCGDSFSGCSSVAHVYDITPGQTINPCKGGFVYSGPDWPDVQNVNSVYNINLGPFTSDNLPGCNYSGTSDKVGSLI